MTGDHDHGAAVNEWVSVIRRACLQPTVKLVALTIASYADPDGTKVFPGIARLTVQCGVDYRSVQRALARLREARLIEMTRRGARRNGKSDEYRLILGADLLEKIHVPTPAAEKLAIERVRTGQLAKQEQSRIRRQQDRLEAADNPVPQTTGESSEPGFRRQGSALSDDTRVVPPSIDPYREDQPPPDEAARRTPRTGSEVRQRPAASRTAAKAAP
jgi:DNA-binding transcriptional ArsR family regulator